MNRGFSCARSRAQRIVFAVFRIHFATSRVVQVQKPGAPWTVSRAAVFVFIRSPLGPT